MCSSDLLLAPFVVGCDTDATAAQEAGLTDALLLGDAAAVVAQATGKVRVPPAHVAHFAEWSALPRPPRFRLRHIKRTQNLAGIALARSQEKMSKA